ncbi:MAG: hypothetical protein KAY24_17805 [Candidatus Eisenbacteria sp.]|nr:hypothetical protein [Candidatus Eisenbacteria bacterium]
MQIRGCPFCSDQHPLRIHGVYKRFVLLPGFSRPVRIKVLRLLCPRLGRSVSLLPAFCLPHRQYGAAVLGRFLKARLLLGATLGAALRSRFISDSGRDSGRFTVPPIPWRRLGWLPS